MQQTRRGGTSYVQIFGGDFELSFATVSRDAPLAVGVYTGAQRPSSISNAPGLAIGAGDRGCNSDTGQFEILEVKMTPSSQSGVGSVQSFTATFEHYCDGAMTPEVGCVHVAAGE